MGYPAARCCWSARPLDYSTRARERPNTTQGCVARLSHHETQLGRLVGLCDPGLEIDPGDATPLFPRALHQQVRVALRRDYETGDQRALSVAQVITQSALYGARAELRPGPIPPRSSRMLAEARQALADWSVRSR